MYKKSLLSASVVLALTSNAHAQEYALFEEVVVSATRTEQQLEDVAGSVSVVTDKQIEKTLSSNVDDVLQYTPGVDVVSDGRMGIQHINIRGMEGNRVNILVDGVSQPYLYDQSFSFISSGRIALDTDMIKAVEVVKGSASSLYGSDGIGGIVAFQTKGPSDFLTEGDGFGGQIKFGFDSRNDAFTENVVLANRSGDLETMVAYTRNDAELIDNFAQGNYQDYSPKDVNAKADNLLVKLQYQIDSANRIEFTGESIAQKASGNIEHASFSSYTNNDTTDRTRLSLKHIWKGETALADKVSTQISWLSHEQNNITDRVGTSRGSVVNEIKDYSYEDKGIQSDVQIDKYLSLDNSEHFFTYGLALARKDIRNDNNIIDRSNNDQASTYFYQPNATETRIGLFVQDQISFMEDDLIVTPGVRWDKFETKPDASTTGIPSGQTYQTNSSSALTARLGTVYSFNDTSKVFAQISQGHRAPTFEELYYSMPGHGYTNVPNPDLESEESITYETGYRHNTDVSHSEIAIFYSDYKNFIDVVDIGAGASEFQHQNIGKATIKGIEFSNQLAVSELFDLPKGLSSNIAASYTQGEDGENKPLNSIQPWNAVLSFDYDAPSKMWGTSLAMKYYAEKKLSDINVDPDGSIRTADEVGTPSATVIDLTAYYRPMDDLTLRAGLFNLTDKKYWKWNDVRGEGALNDDDTQAGRNWAVTAHYTF
ncbi:TonB-dependent hemoglobin/transferrin/lactoferrin family receptor [Vibrio ostreicida]|uniref:TonB-dependent hemoglobin/transferrin/lactoferrin family receptor n=1 Tax=Vibrio ostreicida TaxID=526588 RepID=UPI003B591B15